MRSTFLMLLFSVAPGTYSITVDRASFRTEIASRPTLEINQQARIDFHRKIGHAHDSVNVTTSISPLQAYDNSEGYRLGSAMFIELPIDARNVLSLVTLGPGAIPRQLGGFVHDSDNDVQQGTRGSVEVNPPINGGRASMNAFLLDGSFNTDRNTFAPVVIPPMDAVQEFRIQSSLEAAAFLEAGGGVVDIATKSGGYALHGSAFEFFRNEAADAHNFFDDPTLPRPIFRRNQRLRLFTVTERASLKFRAESFNLFNHPNFGIPGPYPDAGPLFGEILATGEPRRFQFGARLDF